MPFLRSIVTDFVEKRLWPVVAALGVALLGLLAYIALSGGGSSAAPAPSAAVPAAPGGPAISAAPANPNEAVSETTTGALFQRQAGAHDPFVPLGSGTSGTAAAGATPGKGAVGGQPYGTPVSLAKNAVKVSGGTSASSAPASPVHNTIAPPSTKPVPPVASGGSPGAPKPKASVHAVNVLFGVVPTTSGAAGTTQSGAAQLTTHDNLARLSPLPDAKTPLVVFMGVRSDGQTATFALMHEAILNGDAVCRPSTLRCQMIDLRPGQKEQLDYVKPDLSVVRYELDMVSVATARVVRAAATAMFHNESAAGRALLKNDFPPEVGTLAYSYRTGTLVPAARTAATARIHGDAVTAAAVKGSPAYAPPPPHAGPPAVQPGWLGALLHAL